MKLEFGGNILEEKKECQSDVLETRNQRCNVQCCWYAAQVGCGMEEKEKFWLDHDEVMLQSIHKNDCVVIGVDYNWHDCARNRDDEVMGRFGIQERKLEGQMEADYTKKEKWL